MKKRILIATGVLLVALMVTLGTGLAQTSANFNLEWHVIGGGGQRVSSANYIVNSTSGQGVASPSYSFSGRCVVCGGYWCTEGSTVFPCFLPLALKDYP
jgi:hypothetical protein